MDAWIQPWRQKDHESWVISIVKIAEFKDLTLRLPMAEHRFTREKVGAESRSQDEKGCTFYPLHPGSMNQPFKTFQKKWIGLTWIHQKRKIFPWRLGPLSSSNRSSSCGSPSWSTPWRIDGGALWRNYMGDDDLENHWNSNEFKRCRRPRISQNKW